MQVRKIPCAFVIPSYWPGFSCYRCLLMLKNCYKSDTKVCFETKQLSFSSIVLSVIFPFCTRLNRLVYWFFFLKLQQCISIKIKNLTQDKVVVWLENMFIMIVYLRNLCSPFYAKLNLTWTDSLVTFSRWCSFLL